VIFFFFFFGPSLGVLLARHLWGGFFWGLFFLWGNFFPFIFPDPLGTPPFFFFLRCWPNPPGFYFPPPNGVVAGGNQIYNRGAWGGPIFFGGENLFRAKKNRGADFFGGGERGQIKRAPPGGPARLGLSGVSLFSVFIFPPGVYFPRFGAGMEIFFFPMQKSWGFFFFSF